MSDAGRVPLWMVATIGGLAALGLLTLFFFGAYSGLGSSLSKIYNCCKNISSCKKECTRNTFQCIFFFVL